MIRACFIACLVVILSASVALAKTTDERVLDLENRVNSIQQTYLTNNADIAKSLANSGSIQQDFNALKGTVEANGHLIEAQRQDLERQLRDLEHRIQSIEDRMEIFQTQINNAISKVAPAVAEEGKLYQSGLDKANRGEYLNAAADFQSFIKKYPKSSFAASAQYWIGESFFSIRDFKRAIKEYQIFIQDAPRNEKVPQALFKQGTSFVELGMVEESKPFFEKVIKDYPTSPEAAQASAKLQRLSQKGAASTAPQTQQNAPTGPSSYPEQTIEQQRKKYEQQPQTATPSPAEQKYGPTPPAKTETKQNRYIEF